MQLAHGLSRGLVEQAGSPVGCAIPVPSFLSFPLGRTAHSYLSVTVWVRPHPFHGGNCSQPEGLSPEGA